MKNQTRNPSLMSKKAPSELLHFDSEVHPRKRVMSGANFESAFDALYMHRLRSLFTMLGIIIGVAALIAVVMLTQGVNQAVSMRFIDLGADVLTISPGIATYQGVTSGAGSAHTLTLADAQAVAQIPSVVDMSPIVSTSEQIVYGQKNWNTKVKGVYPSYQMIQNWQTSEGAWFNGQDEQSGAAVAVVGQTVVTNLFSKGDQDPIGQTIRIKDAMFRIVGVLQTKGEQGASDADDVIFIPFSTASRRLDPRLHIQQIQVQVATINDLGPVQQDISSLLRTRHSLPGPDPALQQPNSSDAGSFIRDGGSGSQKPGTVGGTSSSLSNAGPPDDFQILSISQLVQSAQESATQLAMLLIGIAGISLAVGGIGIMNIMFVSVTERTREIGIRIAVGARRRDIRNQFLLEAVMLSISGGIVGILIGLGVGLILIWQFNLPLILSPIPSLAAFCISACIGIVSGLYPAISAAKLDPIVAIRRE